MRSFPLAITLNAAGFGSRAWRRDIMAVVRRTSSLALPRKPLKKAIAVIVATSVALGTTQPARAFEPVTIAVLAIAALSALNRPHDINSARIEEIMELLSALGPAIFSLQDASATLLLRTENLPGKIVDGTKNAMYEFKAEGVRSDGDTLKYLIAQGELFKKDRFPSDGLEKWPKYRDDIRRLGIEMQRTRGQIGTMRVDLLPALVASIHLQMLANTASEYGKENKVVREDSIKLLERTLDDSLKQSLPGIQKELRDRITADEAEIAKMMKLPSGKLVAGTFEWYRHTLTTAKYHPGTMGRPIGPDRVLSGGLPEWTETILVHSRIWSRSIERAPIEGVAPDNTVIVIKALAPRETPGALAGAVQHGEADASFEAAMASDMKLENARRRHEVAVRALVEVQRIEGLVRRTIASLSLWTEDQPRQLADEAVAMVGRASWALAEPERVRSRQETDGHIAEMNITRDEFLRIEREGRERIQALIDDNRSKAWMGELQTWLQVYVTVYSAFRDAPASTPVTGAPGTSESSSLVMPNLGSEFAKPPSYGLGDARNLPPVDHRTVVANFPGSQGLSAVPLGDSFAPKVRYSVLGPVGGEAYSLGIGYLDGKDRRLNDEQRTAGLIDALVPGPRLAAAGGTPAEVGRANVDARLRGYALMGSLPFDDAKLTRALTGEKWAQDFYQREVVARQLGLDDGLLQYRAHKIADVVKDGERERLTARVTDQLFRIEHRLHILGVETAPDAWRPAEVIARQVIRGLDAPISFMLSEQDHQKLVDLVHQALQDHPHGTYGTPSRDEVDWQLRYAGKLLPHQ